MHKSIQLLKPVYLTNYNKQNEIHSKPCLDTMHINQHNTGEHRIVSIIHEQMKPQKHVRC